MGPGVEEARASGEACREGESVVTQDRNLVSSATQRAIAKLFATGMLDPGGGVIEVSLDDWPDNGPAVAFSLDSGFLTIANGHDDEAPDVVLSLDPGATRRLHAFLSRRLVEDGVK